ncbi:hypothetical protein SISNIDRAFT_470997 [Sistotremastrum niveocremeum HHB9708]|uniref:DUF6533 domain-containing protein n=1 Tax=Sistotremastrum niveocremeum HHB9708 TaxID=1314777 RepID=A0A164N7L8_9AGAM|nr:hypothetical protein SISNIDRAFT_470997 [Sistotremastrum niveocremeum HHB9708]
MDSISTQPQFSKSDLLDLHFHATIGCVSAISWLVWDMFISFDDEVRYIWRSPNSICKYLYFYSRYIGLAILFAMGPEYNGWRQHPNSLTDCRIPFIYNSIIINASGIASTAMLMIRAVCLNFTVSAQIGAWIPCVVTQVVLFVLIFMKRLSSGLSMKHRSRYMSLIVRDGFWTFVLFAISAILCNVWYATEHPQMFAFTLPWFSAIISYPVGLQTESEHSQSTRQANERHWAKKTKKEKISGYPKVNLNSQSEYDLRWTWYTLGLIIITFTTRDTVLFAQALWLPYCSSKIKCSPDFLRRCRAVLGAVQGMDWNRAQELDRFNSDLLPTSGSFHQGFPPSANAERRTIKENGTRNLRGLESSAAFFAHMEPIQPLMQFSESDLLDLHFHATVGCVSAISWLIWDLFISFDDEVRAMGPEYNGWRGHPNSLTDCRIAFIYDAVALNAIGIASTAMLMLIVYALYGCRRPILYFLLALLASYLAVDVCLAALICIGNKPQLFKISPDFPGSVINQDPLRSYPNPTIRLNIREKDLSWNTSAISIAVPVTDRTRRLLDVRTLQYRGNTLQRLVFAFIVPWFSAIISYPGYRLNINLRKVHDKPMTIVGLSMLENVEYREEGENQRPDKNQP